MRLRSAFVVAALATATPVLDAPPALAQDAGPVAAATLRTVEPAVPRAGDVLVLAGTVENTGDEPLGDVQALLRFSTVPIDDRADIRRVATGRDVRWGRRYIEFFQELGGELEPGETVEFRLEVLVDEIDFGEPGVYAVGVDIRANPVDGERLTVGTARTVVPWLPEDEPLPTVPVALLWPLATQPSLLPDGTLLGDGVAAQLAPNGALTALVEAPGTAPVTWVVDPDLLATVATMADGYAVTTADGTTTEGTGAADAAEWQEAFRTATKGSPSLLVPYANPDLPAIARANPREAAHTAGEALVATREWVGRVPASGRTELAWPGNGVADEGTLAALGSAGATTVVLSSDAVTSATDDALAHVRAGDATLDAVVTDSGLGAAFDTATGADSAAVALAVRQGWLAETASVALDADGAAEPPPIIATAPYGWQPDIAVAQALVDVWTTTPWVQPTALADVAVPERPKVVTPDPAVDAEPPELPPAYVEAVTDLRDQSAQYAALLAEPDALVDELDMAALRAAATTWRAAPKTGAAYTRVVAAETTAKLDQVSVLVPGSVTLSSNKGTFPLTVSNGLPQPVLVRLEITADIPDRMSVAEVPPERVDAGENATVEVTAEAAANGKVPVTVRLTAADGSALGPPQRMVVTATDYGTIGWIVVGAAVALFVAAAVLRLVRGRRRPADAVELPATRPTEPEAMRETAR